MSTVLYISYDGMTDNLGQSQVIPYLIGLKKKGYSIHILSCEKPMVFSHRNNHISKLLKKHSIVWHPIPYTAKPAVFSTLYDIRQLQKEAVRIVHTYHVDILHCRSYIASQVGLYIHKRMKLPWIFDMRGFWADERIDGGIWNLKNPMFRTIYLHFKQLEKKYIASSSAIVSLTQTGKHEIESWKVYGANSTPIHVIPCCADLQLFNFSRISEQKKAALRAELNIASDAYVLSYLGSFGTWYMTDEMFDFFAQLHKQMPQAVFLCITPDKKEFVEAVAAKKHIPLSALRVVKVHREEVPNYASISQKSIFFIKPLYSKKASSPTKMAELLGLGIPLICNAGVGDVEQIMRECHQGTVLHDFTSDHYAPVIAEMCERNQTNPEALYQLACKYYSLERGVELYANIYKVLCNK